MINAPQDALPCTRCRVKTMSSKERMGAKNTDVSRGSIGANLDRNTSILGMFRHESTMLRFRCAGIHEQCCDFSRDLEERATFECFAAIRRLRGSLKLSAFLVSKGPFEE